MTLLQCEIRPKILLLRLTLKCGITEAQLSSLQNCQSYDQKDYGIQNLISRL